MANATMRTKTGDTVAEIIHELETLTKFSDAALQKGLQFADAIAPLVIGVVEKAAAGVYLIPRQENLLFWGIHVLAAARCKALYRPLMRLVRDCPPEHLDRFLGDAETATLGRIAISVFDGDAEPLLDACSDQNVPEYARWSLIGALARLTFDGVVSRDTTVAFLDRFERESLAEPGSAAWNGWQEAVGLLAIDQLRERVRVTWNDGRNPNRDIDNAAWEEQFDQARALAPGDSSLFEQQGLVPIDDPCEALACFKRENEDSEPTSKNAVDLFGADPAELFALDAGDIAWLSGFLQSEQVPPTAMTMEKIDGFFCALVIGPRPVLPSEYMPVLWGGDTGTDRGPIFASLEQAEHVTNLLLRHWNTIARRLDQGYPHRPILMNDFGATAGQQWAIGFLSGIAMRPDEWKKHLADDVVKDFLVVLMMMMMMDADASKVMSKALTPKERSDVITVLPLATGNIHHRIRGQGDPFAQFCSRPRRHSKVGRNDPCPCGSGRKYKRCCGSPDKSASDG